MGLSFHARSESILRGPACFRRIRPSDPGLRRTVNGDRIYNGAMDNASGSAVLLDVATALKQASVHPKRSLIFVFVTGEEERELGSRYFARQPDCRQGFYGRRYQH